eukprot:g14273.t1
MRRRWQSSAGAGTGGDRSANACDCHKSILRFIATYINETTDEDEENLFPSDELLVLETPGDRPPDVIIEAKQHAD